MLQMLNNPVLVGQMPLSPENASESVLTDGEGATGGVFVDILKDLNMLDDNLAPLDEELLLSVDGSALPVEGKALPLSELLAEDGGLPEEPVLDEKVVLDLGAVSLPRALDDAALAQWAGVQRNALEQKRPMMVAQTVDAPELSVSLPDTARERSTLDVLAQHTQRMLMLDKTRGENHEAALATKNLTDILKTNTGSPALPVTTNLAPVQGGLEKPLLTNLPGVAQATIHTPVGQAGWDNELSNRVTWMMRQNVSMAEIKLTPANLGPIEIKVSMANDQAMVSMTAAHAMTRDALEVAIPRLREMLADSGITLANANVSSQSNQDGQGRHSQAGQLASQGGGLEADAGDAELTSEDGAVTSSRIDVDRGLVDIFA